MCANRVKNYSGRMAASFPSNPLHGSTAVAGPGRTVHRVLGSAIRAVGVFLDAAFRVVVLGTDGTKPSGSHAGESSATPRR
jgi:hypothetical protein